MSCVPCLECGDGAGLTRENLDRWTDSIANLLASPEGRHHFKRYLENRSFDESRNTIEFWERCTRIMPKKSEGGDSPPHSFAGSSGSSDRFMEAERGNISASTLMQKTLPSPQKQKVSVSLQKDLELLVNFADQYVNLDLAQMRCLYRMVRMTEEDGVIDTLSQAKQSAMELLLDDYQLFREHLLENRGLLNK